MKSKSRKSSNMESELASSLQQYDGMVLWSRPWAVESDCVQISVLLEAHFSWVIYLNSLRLHFL